eukprot:6185488-Pleurochrysis_carterae.AAC.2
MQRAEERGDTDRRVHGLTDSPACESICVEYTYCLVRLQTSSESFAWMTSKFFCSCRFSAACGRAKIGCVQAAGTDHSRVKYTRAGDAISPHTKYAEHKCAIDESRASQDSEHHVSQSLIGCVQRRAWKTIGQTATSRQHIHYSDNIAACDNTPSWMQPCLDETSSNALRSQTRQSIRSCQLEQELPAHCPAGRSLTWSGSSIPTSSSSSSAMATATPKQSRHAEQYFCRSSALVFSTTSCSSERSSAKRASFIPSS